MKLIIDLSLNEEGYTVLPSPLINPMNYAQIMYDPGSSLIQCIIEAIINGSAEILPVYIRKIISISQPNS